MRSANAALRNSFIPGGIRSVHKLLRRVQSDPVVADRYRRHFRMDQPTLLSYLGSLHVTRLHRPMKFQIFSAPASGSLGGHDQILRRGELVFERADGTPILRCLCGNPLTLGPNGQLHVSNPKVDDADRHLRLTDVANSSVADFVADVISVAPPEVSDSELAPILAQGVASSAPADSPPSIEALEIADLVPTPAPLASTWTPGVGTIPSVPLGIFEGGLPAVGLIPFIHFPSSTPPQRTPDRPNPVPEPLTWIAMGLGLASFRRLQGKGEGPH